MATKKATKKDYVAAAKDLNTALGLDPAIDTTQDVKSLISELVECANELTEADEVKKTTRALLDSLVPEEPAEEEDVEEEDVEEEEEVPAPKKKAAPKPKAKARTSSKKAAPKKEEAPAPKKKAASTKTATEYTELGSREGTKAAFIDHLIGTSKGISREKLLEKYIGEFDVDEARANVRLNGHLQGLKRRGCAVEISDKGIIKASA